MLPRADETTNGDDKAPCCYSPQDLLSNLIASQEPDIDLPTPDATNYPPARHRTPGDIMSEYRATSSRNARATSSFRSQKLAA